MTRLAIVALVLAIAGGGSALATASAEPVVLQPGQSWDAVYEAASPGDVISLAAGDHGNQTVQSVKGNRDGKASHVTFEPVEGATVKAGQVNLWAPHITLRDVDMIGLSIDGYDNRHGGDVLVDGAHVRSGDLTSAQNVTYRGVEFGPNTEGQSSSYPWPQDALIVNAWPTNDGNHPADILFDRVHFHDVLEPTSTAHSDCLQFTAGERVTVRDAVFERCEHADIMVAPDQGPILDFTVETSELGRTLSGHYSINADNKGKDATMWDRVSFLCNIEHQNIRLTAPRVTYEPGPCEPDPTPTPTPTPTPEPTSTPTPDPTPTSTPEPTPDPTPMPTPEPVYDPACAPTCDEQIAARDDKLARIRAVAEQPSRAQRIRTILDE